MPLTVKVMTKAIQRAEESWTADIITENKEIALMKVWAKKHLPRIQPMKTLRLLAYQIKDSDIVIDKNSMVGISTLMQDC